MSTTLRRGRCYPLGATLDEDGVNFSLFSKNATRIELCLFDQVDDYRPARVITLWPHRNRTFYYWHVFVPGLQAGQIYAYRVEG
ncbi:MAG: glycogen debranching enzyme, partial [Chloroflexota bacterium]